MKAAPYVEAAVAEPGLVLTEDCETGSCFYCNSPETD